MGSQQSSLAAFAVKRLFNASASGDVAVVESMLKENHQAVVNCINPRGQTPLAVACAYGQVKVVEILLAAGCVPSLAHPTTGTVSLHVATSNGFQECVRALVRGGADISASDVFGNTADIFASAPPMSSASGANADSSADVKLISMRKACLHELRRR